MHLANTAVMETSLDVIFPMAVRVEDWPRILPHYRAVHILKETEAGRLVDMAAWRGWIPVRWQALQQLDRDNLRIRFRHTGGVTRGMAVEWQFEHLAQEDNAIRVTISHDLEITGPELWARLKEHIVGKMFVDYIATRTLRRMKELAESHAGSIA